MALLLQWAARESGRQLRYDSIEAERRAANTRLRGDIGELVPLQVLDGMPVSYTHLRAHETVLELVCRIMLEKKKTTSTKNQDGTQTNPHFIHSVIPQ
mgnify:CR=1 FL=1